MSYSIISYLTDADNLRKIYGSRNSILLNELLLEWKDELKYFDFFFELESGKSQQVVEDFILGQTRFKNIAYLYGYIYELFCRKCGEEVLPDSECYELDFLEKLTKEYSAFLPIPLSSDFPHIVSIENIQLNNFKTKHLSDLINEKLEDFESVIKKAQETGKDLVFFNY